ncbi:hypothetical protein TWF481_008401 [Arthrobotrys musiformis]|uniref:Uncharacterized protein n=1 Tax=Arthrobotrys musiformis TaxID=47236 RepID=A0AAV9W714_9PEZI
MDALIAAGFIAPDSVPLVVSLTSTSRSFLSSYQQLPPQYLADINITHSSPAQEEPKADLTFILPRVPGASPSPLLIDFSDSEPSTKFAPNMLPPSDRPKTPGSPGSANPRDSAAFSAAIPRINEELLRLQDEIKKASRAQNKEAFASLAAKGKEIAELRAQIEANKTAHALEVQALQKKIEVQKELMQKEIEVQKLIRKTDIKEAPDGDFNAKILQDTVEAFKKTSEAKEKFIGHLSEQLQECRQSSRHHPSSDGNPYTHTPLLRRDEKMAKDMKALEKKYQVTQDAFFKHMDKTVIFQNDTTKIISELEREIQIYQSRDKLFTEQITKIRELEKEIELLKKKNAKVEKDLDDAITVNSHLGSEVENFQKENAELRQQLVAIELENSKLKGQLDKNTEILQKSTDKMAKMDKERKISTSILHRRGLHVEVMQNAIENLEADKHRLEVAAAARTKFGTRSLPGVNTGPGLRANAAPFKPSGIRRTDFGEE